MGSLYIYAATTTQVGVAYQILSGEKSRRDYDAQGMADQANPDEKSGSVVDPSTMFTMMFGSEAFEPYVGVLRGASLMDQLMQPRTEAEEKAVARVAARAARAARRADREARAASRDEEQRRIAEQLRAEEASGAGGGGVSGVLRAAASAQKHEAAADDAEAVRDDAAEETAAREEAAEEAAAEEGRDLYGGVESQHRLQRKREVRIAVLLAERVQPYVDACCEEKASAAATTAATATEDMGAASSSADDPSDSAAESGSSTGGGKTERKDKAVRRWRAAVEDEASVLADAPFGERLLQGIAWSYQNAAHQYPASVAGMPYSVSNISCLCSLVDLY